MYGLKWTLGNTIERYTARWVVLGFLKILDVHYDPFAMHAPVTSDSSLMSLLSLTVRNKFQMKQLDVITAFLNYPQEHEVWVRFPAGYDHPLGHTFAILHKSLHGLKQAASDWYAL